MIYNLKDMKTKEEIKKMKKPEMEAYIIELQKVVIAQGKRLKNYNEAVEKVLLAVEECVKLNKE